jgi:hydrogenase nickel incorporation protein HypA/HybF
MLTAEAESRGAERVTLIKVVAGEAGAYMEESLAFYLSFFAKGGPVEGAKLELRVVKPTLKCKACGLEFERRRFSFQCPSCGGDATIVDLGGEFYIESAELSFGSARSA